MANIYAGMTNHEVAELQGMTVTHDAPCKLIRDYYNRAFPKPNIVNIRGKEYDFNGVLPQTFSPIYAGKVAFAIPRSEGGRNIGTSPNHKFDYRNFHKGCLAVPAVLGRNIGNRDEGSQAGSENSKYITDTDWAVVVKTKKVSDWKGTYKIAEPYVIQSSTVDPNGELHYKILGQDNTQSNMPLPLAVSGVFFKGNITGKASGQNVNATINTSESYDNWLVIDSIALYTRQQGSTDGRVKNSSLLQYFSYTGQYPCMFGRINDIQLLKQKVNLTALGLLNTYQTQEVDLSMTPSKDSYITQVRMPWTGCNIGGSMSGFDNYAGTQTRAIFGYPNLSDLDIGLLESGINVGQAYNTPWIPGYYNNGVKYLSNVSQDSQTYDAWNWTNTGNYANPDTVGNQRLCDYHGWVFTDGNSSPDYLMECYNAKQIVKIQKDETTFDPTQNRIIGIGQNDATYPVWIPSSVGGNNMAAMAFPNWDDIVNFFADWGIVCTDNEDDAINAPNDIDGDPWGGSSNPDTPGNYPWDNNSTGSDPVDFDPNQQGTDPFQPEFIPAVTPAVAANGYVISTRDLYAIQEWLCWGNFLEDSSNLFTNKMSAFNGATMFPFDVVAHDPAHCQESNGVNMAGASYEFACHKIVGAYNSWVDGGSITFGQEYVALRGDYNAFSTSNYEVYVPFVGMVTVPPSAVIFRKLQLRYAVDMISGAGSAFLYSYSTDGSDNGFLVNISPCQVGQPIPLVSDNTTQRNMAITMGTINGAVNNFGGTSNWSSKIPEKRDAQGLITQKAGTKINPLGIAGSILGSIGGAIQGGFDAALSNPYAMSHAGSIGSLTGWSSGLIPFLTVTSQIPAIPNGYGYLMGRTSSLRGRIGVYANGNNFIQCYTGKLTIPGATSTEILMIKQALEGGVYV